MEETLTNGQAGASGMARAFTEKPIDLSRMAWTLQEVLKPL